MKNFLYWMFIKKDVSKWQMMILSFTLLLCIAIEFSLILVVLCIGTIFVGATVESIVEKVFDHE